MTAIARIGSNVDRDCRGARSAGPAQGRSGLIQKEARGSDRVGRHTRGGKERPRMRVIPRGGFRPVENTSQLVDLLFPELPAAAAPN